MLEPYLVSTAISQPQMLMHEALAWIQNLGGVGGIVFVLLYIAATICLIPGSILTLGAGVLFGVAWGSFYVLIGAIIGETCAFLLGRYLVRDWISQKIAANKTFMALTSAINREGLKIILLTRLSPVFPFSLLNYAFGITGISLKDYFLGSIGIIPMTITYVYLGSLASELANISDAAQFAHPQLQWGIKIFGSLATITAALYLTRVARQALDRSLRESAI